MNVKIDDIIALYIRKRDELEDMEKRHKEAKQPLEKDIQMIEGALQKYLQDNGQQSASSTFGVAYLQSWKSVKVADPLELWRFAKENDRFDLYPKSVVKTVVDEIGAENVPGITVQTGVRCNVRRK